MKIRLTTIPYEGLKLDFELSLEQLNSRLSEGSSKDIVCIGPPKVALSVRPIHGATFEASGTIKASFRQPCATCAEETDRRLEVPFKWLLEHRAVDSGPNGLQEDDIGIVTYEGEHIDMEEPLQEAIILQLSPFWHPDRNDQGMCTLCGKVCVVKQKPERKSATNLGELLQKATKSTR